jgi:hypothetical protein
MRAFLEMSVDHYLEKNGHDLQRKDQKSGKSHWKTLDAKLDEVVDSLVNKGAAKSHFAQVKRSISVTTSPLHTGLLHDYVHNRYATPSLQELTAAWNNAQPLFEHIWP